MILSPLIGKGDIPTFSKPSYFFKTNQIELLNQKTVSSEMYYCPYRLYCA